MELGMGSGISKNRFDFRSEKKILGRDAIVKRLYAEPIASDEQSPQPRIPDRESKHAAKVMNAVASIFFVGMDNGFCIAVGGVAVATRQQLPAYGEVVVDLAVKDNPD